VSLIKSISGIRGTIGGKPGENLSPLDVVKFTAAFGTVLLEEAKEKRLVIGRDARPSGVWISDLILITLTNLGFDVVDLGLSTTPTVQMAVVSEQADGGIIITASHNPGQWNALKLLNSEGEFISQAVGNRVLELAANEEFSFVENKKLGTVRKDDTQIQKHIDAILAIPYVDVEAIRARKFRIAIDAVNSTGGIAVPMLLEALGVEPHSIKKFFCEPDGNFPHNPEPVPENLTFISNELKNGSFDLGIVVDPDVDRLALVNEDGSMFGEEFTLVAVADYVLSKRKGNTVSNLSSTRALRDITQKAGGEYHAAAVGEVNVVEKMKEISAVIGGEGNGGIIYPDLHYGRDALVGIALFLSHLANFKGPISRLRAGYPNYFMSKNKIELTKEINVDKILNEIQARYAKEQINTIDGVKIDFDDKWVHLRRSNTEPIIRIYAEADSSNKVQSLTAKIIGDIKEIISEHKA
jgi:phosphomannomutase